MYSFSDGTTLPVVHRENEPLTSPDESNKNPLRTSGDFHARENTQRREGLEETAHPKPILRNPPEGHGTTFYWSVRRHRRSRHLQVCLLRAAIIHLRNQVSLRLWMAQLLLPGR